MALSLFKDKVVSKLGWEILMITDPGADEDDHGKLGLGGAEEWYDNEGPGKGFRGIRWLVKDHWVISWPYNPIRADKSSMEIYVFQAFPHCHPKIKGNFMIID